MAPSGQVSQWQPALAKDAVQVKHTFIDVKTGHEEHLAPERRYTDTCVEYASKGKLRSSTDSHISQASTVEPVIEAASDSEESASLGCPRSNIGGSCLDSETGSRTRTGHSERRSRMNTGSFSMGSDYDYSFSTVNSSTSAMSGPPGAFGGIPWTNSFGSQGCAWDMSQMMMVPMPMMTQFYTHQAATAAAMAVAQEFASGRRSRTNSGRESVASTGRRTVSDVSLGKHSNADAKEKKTKKEPEAKAQKEEPRVVDVLESERTTVIFRHLTAGCNRDDLLELLAAEGFTSKFDVVYMPTHFKDWSCIGYAFVNFRTHELALEAMRHFQGREWETAEGDQPCEVVWSNAHQGFESHIERYRNSPLMHESVPDEAKPIVFDKAGHRMTFPPPTECIKPPGPRVRGTKYFRS